MDEHYYFISYSRRDAPEFATRLADELRAGPPQYRAWVDRREMQPGQQDWDSQLVEAIKTCAALVFVMTTDSVRDESGCKNEWVAALRYKKPVIPVRLHAGAELPFRLNSLQFIDFSESFDTGVAQLRRHLAWVSTPAGVLQSLRSRQADAEFQLGRVAPEQEQRVRDDLDELTRRIEEQERVVNNPETVAEQTGARIEAGLERERQPERPPVAPPRAKFVNPPPLIAPGYFQDRYVETELIGKFLRDDGSRLISVVGRGGVGKTAMVCRLLKALEAGRLPDELGELPVDGIVYLSPLGVHPVDFAHMFADLCRLLPTEVAEPLLKRRHAGQESPATLMRSLLDQFPGGRSVLLLDNFQDVVDDEGQRLTDTALDEALRALLTAPPHGVKVIATTRVAPRDLMLEQPAVQRRLNLDEGLPSPHAENVLREMDADGSLGIKDAPAELLADAAKCTRGFPRALEALVAILNADRNTTLPELLAATERLPANVVDALVGEAFNRLDALAQEVMQALAIYGGPVPAVAIDYLLQPFEPTIDSAPVLGRLVNMQFARRDAARYYVHQVDRDYALSRMGVGEPSDRYLDPPPFTQFALHGRAADYFEQTRTPRESWETLDDLAPQRAEFDLRCQAGDYDTAAEILLDISYDYLQTWGYSRLARDLHERLQGHITDPSTAAQCAGDLGLCYYNLGEVRRAVELHTEAIAQARAIADRWGESVNLGLLANDYWVLADVDRAIELRNEALEIAREVGDRQSESNHLGGLGICYAQGRDIARSIALYEEALEIAREVGDRKGEAVHLSNLGIEYERQGYVRQAIALQDQALAIDRDEGSREGEAYELNNLGSCYAALGQFERAIELHDTALTIAREIGDRRCEGLTLGSLADKRLELGQTQQAIELYEQARAIAVDIGDRGNEASALGDLGEAHGARGDWPRAIEYGEAAVRMADEIGFELAAAELRRRLARLYLLAGRVDAARATAQAALDRDYGPARADLMLLRGVADMRLGDVEAAREALLDALEGADAQLLQTADAYDALDRRALALSGLSVAGEAERLGEAEATFRSARAVASAAGTVAGVLRLFDALAACDETGLLGPVRSVAAGDG